MLETLAKFIVPAALSAVAGVMFEKWRRMRRVSITVAVRDWWLDDKNGRYTQPPSGYGVGTLHVTVRNSGSSTVHISKVYWACGIFGNQKLTTESWESEIAHWATAKLPAKLNSGEECIFQMLRWLRICVELTDGSKFTAFVDESLKRYIRESAIGDFDAAQRKAWYT